MYENKGNIQQLHVNWQKHIFFYLLLYKGKTSALKRVPGYWFLFYHHSCSKMLCEKGDILDLQWGNFWTALTDHPPLTERPKTITGTSSSSLPVCFLPGYSPPHKLGLFLVLSLSQPSTFYLLHFTWRSSSLGLTMICLFHAKQFKVPKMLSLLQSWLYQEQKQGVLKESCASGSLTNRKKHCCFGNNI